MSVQDLLNKLYGVQVIQIDDPIGVTSVSQTAGRVLDNNPGAVQLTIINTGGSDMMMWTDSSVSQTKGIRIAANGGSYEIDFTRFGTLPSLEWWMVGVGGSTTVSCKRLVIL